MPFGLRTAAQTFQRFIYTVLRGAPGVMAYVDDLMVYGSSKEEHDARLKEVLDLLDGRGVTINVDKCKFALDQVDFLGFRVQSTGLSPLPEKVLAITGMARPVTTRQVQQWLGMMNFYHMFIPCCSITARSIYKMIHGLTKNKPAAMVERDERRVQRDQQPAGRMLHPGTPAPIGTAPAHDRRLDGLHRCGPGANDRR